MNATFRNSRWLAAALVPAALLSAQSPAPAPDPGTYQGESADRYAMVRRVEGDVRIVKGAVTDDLTEGTPVGEGDVVESRGRGVLQLADGTRVAFAGATRFTVASLFADRDQDRQVLFRLDHGRLRIQLGGESRLRFRVDTPSGSATCFDHGGFEVQAERDQTTRVLVFDGHVDFVNDLNRTVVDAGDRLTVYSATDSLDRVRGFNTYDSDDFDQWSERAMLIRPGESWDRVPPELRYYSDSLDGRGHWVDSDEYGWVWQPAGVSDDWRPYYDGRWAAYPGGMTWISPEPWAYLTYHYGRWNWSVGLGWTWIPGVYYSPAWVAWDYTGGYCGWAPLGYYNTPCHWGYGAWGGGYCWNVVSINYINVANVRSRIYSDAGVLRSFNTGTGATTWQPGGRSLTPPWRTSPLMISHGEFRNPAQIQAAFRPDVNRERLMAYDRQIQAATGRSIHFRTDPVQPRGANGRPAPGPQRIPFENRPAPGQDRTGAWTRSRGFENRPAPGQDRTGTSPRDRGFENRPAPGQDRTGAPPRDRGFENRPAPAPDRRYDSPGPRDRSFENRPAPAPDRSFDSPGPRDRGFESRPEPGPGPRPEAPAPRERAPEPRRPIRR